MIHYTSWQGGKLVQRRLPVIGERVSLLSYGLTLAMIALVVMLSGCGAADDTVLVFGDHQDEPDSSYESEPVAEPEAPPAVKPAPAIMYVAPDDNADLLLLVKRTIDRVHARTGAVIEISDDGIPIRVSGADQGRALTDKWCFGGGCDVEHGTRIRVSAETLARIYVDNFADNALAHEFAHVLSGWGHCSDEVIDESGHLPIGHIVSNGNEGYGQMSWTDADTRLTCSCGTC